jgi:YHS domain-containing protein
MRQVLSIAALIAVVAFVGQTVAAEGKGKAICPVAGKPANAKHTVEYKGASVSLCCGNCKKAFTANPAKFAAKANLQLVATGQAKQVNCPFAGKAVNPAQSVTVAGTEVSFCCGGCKGKAAKATGDDQIKLIFNDKAFAKGFKVTKK